MAHPNAARRRAASAHALSDGLGWFSIGLGLAEVVAARGIARWLGMPAAESLVRAYGVREIATGIGLLSTRPGPGRMPWLWGRIGGDALDLATLAAGLDARNPRRENVRLSVAAVAGVTALDLLCARWLAEAERQRLPPPDYSNRSGLPRPPEAMRGAARDFVAPRDMRIPEALRPYRTA